MRSSREKCSNCEYCRGAQPIYKQHFFFLYLCEFILLIHIIYNPGYNQPYFFKFSQISQIYRWKRKFAEDENAFANGRKGVCGRKRSLSENDVNNVLNVIRERPFSSIRAIQERLHLNCCRQTIWRAMTKANYKCRRPAHKIDYDNDN